MGLQNITPAMLDKLLGYLLEHGSLSAMNTMQVAAACEDLGVPLIILR